MVQLDYTVDPNMQSSGGGYEPMPAGDYVGEICAVEEATSQAGNKYLRVQVRVEGHGVVFDNLNLWHPNAKAVKIATERLNEIGKALGMASISDTDQLLAKQVMISVVVEPDNGGTPRNAITAYKPAAAAGSQPPPTAAAAATSPATSASSGNLPWEGS